MRRGGEKERWSGEKGRWSGEKRVCRAVREQDGGTIGTVIGRSEVGYHYRDGMALHSHSSETSGGSDVLCPDAWLGDIERWRHPRPALPISPRLQLSSFRRRRGTGQVCLTRQPSGHTATFD